MLKAEARRIGIRRWLQRNWRLAYPNVTFPTFARQAIQSKPQFDPMGLDGFKAHEHQRYINDQSIIRLTSTRTITW